MHAGQGDVGVGQLALRGVSVLYTCQQGWYCMRGADGFRCAFTDQVAHANGMLTSANEAEVREQKQRAVAWLERYASLYGSEAEWALAALRGNAASLHVNAQRVEALRFAAVLPGLAGAAA